MKTLKLRYGLIGTIVVCAALAFFVSSCYYDSEEVLYPAFGKACDTTNVTYAKSIAPILSDNCVSCHGSTFKATGGGVRLDNYDDVKSNLENVIGAINHSDVNSPMPKNSAKLSDCKLKQFDIWNKAGALNN